MSRFNPFYSVPCKYGAPMGRRSDWSNASHWDATTKLCAKHQGGTGDYDSGGAYWGISREDGPVWAVWERGQGDNAVVYVRAHSREEAINIAIAG